MDPVTIYWTQKRTFTETVYQNAKTHGTTDIRFTILYYTKKI